ncbi:MAG: hypothetical protein ACRDQ7_10540 [Haloechinothrix sp.]
MNLAVEAARICGHGGHEAIDRFHLAERVGVEQVARDEQRLGYLAIQRCRLEPGADEEAGDAARDAVGTRHRFAVGEPEEQAPWLEQGKLAVVNGAADRGDRSDRQLRVRCRCQQRQGATEGPAHDVHRAAGLRFGGAPDRVRNDLVDPVFDTHRAVGEADLAVID